MERRGEAVKFLISRQSTRDTTPGWSQPNWTMDKKGHKNKQEKERKKVKLRHMVIDNSMRHRLKSIKRRSNIKKRQKQKNEIKEININW